MSNIGEIRFGEAKAGPGGCCGEPEQCTAVSKGCLWKVRKQERAAAAAAAPKCENCGYGRNTIAHIVPLHSDWSASIGGRTLRPHAFRSAS